MAESSRELFEEAKKIFPGGVNSPVRAAVKPYPFFVKYAKGAYVYTEEGNRLIDYVLGYGPLILGHANDYVLNKIKEGLNNGWLFGAPNKNEINLGKKIISYVKPGGKIRYVNSGTEATMTAIRLARGYTNRKYLVKFDGCYHGSHDSVLVQAGSAATEFGVPNTLGVPNDVAKLTLVAKYNDLNSLENIFRNYGDEIAAVIVEPVIGNMGVIKPNKDFLQGLRKITKDYGSLLIFDEVITGFRLSMGGAQKYFNIDADIVTLGKIIGGGFPVGAVVSKSEIMDYITPEGKVFNAGTFNAHPITMIAGLYTLEFMEKNNVIDKASNSAKILNELLLDYGIEYTINRVESMMQIFFTDKEINNADDARMANKELYTKFHESLINKGVFIPPSQFETMFTSYEHNEDIINYTAEKIKEVIKGM
ncbi:glutamate-1-semialdehyde-2,1-aminomutase [Caldisphaera lagunensis DSM 15908]|uniref:Glutamate-1-semialdehyde 2,1-aminomutase n=1 Tax=Caldisphaera lagunensis (strain DSM 15908 / JCM 11604 / ANMR 0165 / IC-154) TaxID=1056495 RepID=L0ACK4_CALLD|nr:glutamate-1-semialdehyde 2,1-aminomutase [Caldisphaera lagunensis]AFZ70877.1 glutamate-1-semialdehyde-2,1-aminomutase [Caldisphaera lagunensis DSM 15908]